MREKTKSIRLTQLSVGLLYEMSGEFQVQAKNYISPSEAIVLLRALLRQAKQNNGGKLPDLTHKG